MIDDKTTREQLAAIVSEAVRADGHRAVLVGGSVVALYTKEMFPSDDLDFVVDCRARELEPTLRRLGFTDLNNTIARHPSTRFYVQLLQGRVSIGERHDVRPVDRKTPFGVVKTLSPLDCVLDRLAAFLYYNDRPSLRQAVEVALRHDVSIPAIKKWFDGEPENPAKKAEKLEEFRQRLEKVQRERKG